MKKTSNLIKKIIIFLIIQLVIISIATFCYAKKIYTEELYKGDTLKLIGENWNIYNSKKNANEANSSKAIGTLKKGETFEVLVIDENVIKIGTNKYIYYGKTAAQNFERISIGITSISLNETTKVLKVGEQFQIIPTVNKNLINYKDVIWKSNKRNIAYVDNSGMVTAKKEGEAVITVKDKTGKITAECIIKVIPDITLEFKNEIETVNKEDELNLKKVIKIKNAKFDDIEWVSSNENVAIIEDGVIKTNKIGTTVITAKINEIEDSCKFIVLSEEINVEKLTVKPTKKQ